MPVGFPVTRGPQLMHVLCYDGLPIAASERMERLSMQLSAYTANQQALMSIHSVEVLE